MIDFIVIAAPRSGTAWCANWLTNHESVCIHEPLMRVHFDQWDKRFTYAKEGKRKVGVACTGIAMYPDFLRKHSARKLILHRDRSEIEESLKGLALGPLHSAYDKLDEIDGMHVSWKDLFEDPYPIYRYLVQGTSRFDWVRHDLLCKLNIQADFEKMNPDPQLGRRLIKEMQGGA